MAGSPLNISVMVHAAIMDLNEPEGSSTQAIKKYIVTNFGTDMDKVASHVNEYLNRAAEDGTLIRTKGRGAAGSFTLPFAIRPGNFNNIEKKPKTTDVPTKNPKTAAQPKVTEDPQTLKSNSYSNITYPGARFIGPGFVYRPPAPSTLPKSTVPRIIPVPKPTKPNYPKPVPLIRITDPMKKPTTSTKKSVLIPMMLSEFEKQKKSAKK